MTSLEQLTQDYLDGEIVIEDIDDYENKELDDE